MNGDGYKEVYSISIAKNANTRSWKRQKIRVITV